MIKRFLTILFLSIILFHPQFIQADNHQSIEIFDSNQEKVVKTIPVNDKINNMVVDWINEINGVYQSINPMPNNGYAIRFPIKPSIYIQNRWLDTNIEEVYLTIPENDDPCLIIFEKDDKINFFQFPGNLTELSDLLDFELE